MDENIIDELIHYLKDSVTEARFRRMQQVLEKRTRHLCVVLEDLYQAHNASAVMRTCDCLGIQDIHFLEEKNSMKVNDEIAMGSEKWLSVYHHNGEQNVKENLYHFLKNKNYSIVVTTPHQKSYYPENIPLDKPMALIFGTEKEGVSEFWMSRADAFLQIPMFGFTESFNISVSAAIILYTLVRRKEFQAHVGLSESERKNILLKWLISSIREGEEMAKNFLEKKDIPLEKLRLWLVNNP
jgi:tRNA (guanosine-2'-O-)-methyltransferase